MKKSIFLLLACSSIFTISSSAQSWKLTGNGGTNPATNFIGTTDGKALVFRTSNLERLRVGKEGKVGIGLTDPQQVLDVNGNINIGSSFGLFMENHRVLKIDSFRSSLYLGNGTGVNITNGSYNTATGHYALFANTAGYYNTANGAHALYKNTTGHENTAQGMFALYSNTTGNYNTANGTDALNANTTGSNNTASGYRTLYYNTTGSYNSGTGLYALYSNTTGDYNAAQGAYSLFLNTTGYKNTSQGYASLYHNTTGTWNTAVGDEALYQNTNGTSNAAFGVAALYANTSGGYNTATGNNSLTNNTTGSFNTVNGEEAMLLNTSGSSNTAVGTSAMYNNTGSNYNCAFGYLAMAYANPGWNNTAVGAFTGPATDFDGMYNTIAVGNSTFVYASNQARFGNSSTTSIGGYANWTNISDGRVKKNIKANVPGLTFIKKLKPITYNLDLDAAERIQHFVRKDKNGKIIQPEQNEINARNEKQQIVYTGFIAQDVEKAAKELNYDFSGVDAAKNEKDLYGLRYAEFVVPLVKAVQELSQQNDELKKQNELQQQEIDELKALIVSGNQQAQIHNQPVKISASTGGGREEASLLQNVPNPFNHTTTVNYTLPQSYSSAKIIITDKTGKAVREVNLPAGRQGVSSLKVDASVLSAGAYQYSLYVDGRLIDTKQMEHLK